MTSRSSFRPEVRRALPVILALKFAGNIASRMLFPFLPAITKGTGLSEQAMGVIVFGRDLTGLAATEIGRRTVTFGNRRSMLLGASGLCAGLFLAALGPVGIVIGLIVFGFGRVTMQIGIQSWIGDEVPFERRARASGLIETTWAAAAFIGIPVTGVLIEAFGWRAAFLLPAVLCLLTVTALLRNESLRSSGGPAESPVDVPASSAPKVQWTTNMRATILTPAILQGAAIFLFFGHGFWLEDTYDFDASAIGFAVVAVGAAELVASLGSSAITDRIGKRVSILAGTMIMTLGTVVLGLVDRPPLVIGLGLLVVIFFGFEFAIVSTIPLIAELSPNARAHLIGYAVGTTTVAKALAGLASGFLFGWNGFGALIVASVIASVSAFALTLTAVSEPEVSVNNL